MSEEVKSIVRKAVIKMGGVTHLASYFGVSRSTVSRWLHGVHCPDAEHIIKMQTIIRGKK